VTPPPLSCAQVFGTRGVAIDDAIYVLMATRPFKLTYSLDTQRLQLVIECRRFEQGGTSVGAASTPSLAEVKGAGADAVDWRFSPLSLTWEPATSVDDWAAVTRKYGSTTWNAQVLDTLWPSL